MVGFVVGAADKNYQTQIRTINLSTVIIYIFSFVLLLSLLLFQFQTLTISDLSKSNNFEEVYEEVNIMVAY